jgi:hypothetical protein
MANPGQPEPPDFHQNLANGLKKFMLVSGMDKRMVTLVECPEDPVKPG